MTRGHEGCLIGSFISPPELKHAKKKETKENLLPYGGANALAAQHAADHVRDFQHGRKAS
jgi:hypothetical protein